MESIAKDRTTTSIIEGTYENNNYYNSLCNSLENMILILEAKINGPTPQQEEDQKEPERVFSSLREEVVRYKVLNDRLNNSVTRLNKILGEIG